MKLTRAMKEAQRQDDLEDRLKLTPIRASRCLIDIASATLFGADETATLERELEEAEARLIAHRKALRRLAAHRVGIEDWLARNSKQQVAA